MAYRDPLAFTEHQRAAGLRGVKLAKRALAEAKRNSPVVWRDLVVQDGLGTASTTENTDARGNRKRQD